MSNTYYEFDGFDEMEKKLSQMIEQEYPAEFRALVLQLAKELQGKTKSKTPVRYSFLQEAWKVGNIQKRGNEYYIEVFNNMEYAEPVEYGHRTRGGKGFVKGAHMMELSLTELNDSLPSFLQDWLSVFIGTHDF